MVQSSGLVTIFGGSGFVGRHTTSVLAKRGWRVRAAVRRPDLAGHLQPMGSVGQIHAVQSNLRYPESVASALAGATAVVNAVGILAPVGRQSFDAVHADGARAVARAAREAGVKRFVHISAIGADAASSARYAQSKAAGEAAVPLFCGPRSYSGPRTSSSIASRRSHALARSCHRSVSA
jgi:uncharacterized protein YbjT (DUF2867 family)